jgi:hypothetical protein
MIKFAKVISTQFDDVKRRLIKVLRMGRSDVQTPNEVMPFGIDSSPIKDMIALHVETDQLGRRVIVGYLNKNQVAKNGETRLFSLDAQGNLKAFLHLKNDGSIELNGNSDNLVRYTPLDTALQSQATAINTELGKIAAVLNGIIPGSYVVTPVSINTSQSKINDLKSN